MKKKADDLDLNRTKIFSFHSNNNLQQNKTRKNMIDESAYLSQEILVKCPVYRKVTEITFFSSQK